MKIKQRQGFVFTNSLKVEVLKGGEWERVFIGTIRPKILDSEIGVEEKVKGR